MALTLFNICDILSFVMQVNKISKVTLDNPFDASPDEVRNRAKEIRKKIVWMNSHAGQGHTGADLSETDILAALFFRVLKYRQDFPEDSDRDRFILSKGHGVGGLYCTLAEAGILEETLLSTYLQFDSAASRSPGPTEDPLHRDQHGRPGPWAFRGRGSCPCGEKEQRDLRVFVLLGDGELQEGSTGKPP